MGSLLKSITSGVIVAVIFTMMLSALGFAIGPIIASAGILGVALGFGSQTLVKDFLSGIFLIFEDQYGVGDVVNLGEGLSGTVEAVSLRVTRLRDTNGTVWYVRNGELFRVGNMSQNWARTVLDVQVSAHEDLVHVRRVLADVADDLWHDEDFEGVVIEEPEIWGVEAMTPDAVTLRLTLKTAPMEQWRVARVMRERIKARFDHEGIAAPYPTSVVMNRTHEDGEEPTAVTTEPADA
jgi:small conductance mechanosensitive channel